MLISTPLLGALLASALGTNASRPTSPQHRAVLQRGHGFVVVAGGIEEAVDYAYYAASNARVLTTAVLLARAVGGEVRRLSAGEMRGAADMDAWIAFKPWRQWVWEVERSGVYVNELGGG